MRPSSREGNEGASARRIAAISDAVLVPSNARRLVSILYRTAPNANMSVRASAGRPSICSGAMYWTVPSRAPALFPSSAGRQAPPRPATTPVGGMRARPKSRSLACRRAASPIRSGHHDVAGLESRWMMP